MPDIAHDADSGFEIPRYIWANTTTRDIKAAFKRISIICDNAASMDVAAYPTTREYQAALGALMTPPVDGRVINKTMLLAERLGILSRQRSGSRTNWYCVYPAGEALLSDPDPDGMLTWLLLQVPFSETLPVRYNIEILRFLSACVSEGIDTVRVDQLSYFMASKRKHSRNWKKEAAQLKEHTEKGHTAISSTAWERLLDRGGHYRKVVEDSVDVLMRSDPTNKADVGNRVLELRSDLVPRSRESSIEAYTERIAESVLARDRDNVIKLTWDSITSIGLDSNFDLICTALKYLGDVGLIDMLPGSEKAGKRISLTDFGAEAVASLPEKDLSYDEAIRHLRSSTETPFKDRTKNRIERFREKLANDKTAEGRTRLAQQLDWDNYRGRHQAGAFEAAVVYSVMASATLGANYNPLSGLRTKVNHSFESIRHAPGEGADGWCLCEDGNYILIEVTGAEAGNQIRQELEPVLRHSRDFVKEHGEKVVTLFVAPTLDLGMVSHLGFGSAESISDASPAVKILPMTTDQLKALLISRASIEAFVKGGIIVLDEYSDLTKDGRTRDLVSALNSLVDGLADSGPRA
jgi:hypothetical protein